MPSVETVREQFGRLIKQTQELCKPSSNNAYSFEDDMLVTFTQIRTSAIILIHTLFKNDAVLRDKFASEIKSLPENPRGAIKLNGILESFQQNHKVKILNIRAAIETSVVLDYMSLVEQLLGEGVEGQYDYIPAAVLAGAVLEDALRRLCERQSPSISIKADGKPKMLKALIDDLRQSKVFNETKAKQLEVWTSIRNSAAHGKFDEINRSDVRRMIEDIKSFLEDYL